MIFLLLVDAIAITVALYCAFVSVELFQGHFTEGWVTSFRALRVPLPLVAGVIGIAFAREDLYKAREHRLRSGRLASALTLAAAVILVCLLATERWIALVTVFPVGVFFVAGSVALLRARYERLSGAILRNAGVRRKLVIIGRRSLAPRLADAIGRTRAGIEYAIVGLVTSVEDDRRWPDRPDLPTLGTLEHLTDILAEHAPFEVVLADPDLGFQRSALLKEAIVRHNSGAQFQAKLLVPSPAYSYARDDHVQLVQVEPRVLLPSEWTVKRIADIGIASAVLVVALPLLALLAGVVKLTAQGGPTIMRDRRVGYMGKQFEMLRFNAWAARQGGEDQAWLARLVGTLLGRFHLEHAPQLLNVIRGEMTLVGPLPLRVDDYQRRAGEPHLRQLVRPGLTGLCQISGASVGEIDRRIRLDLQYISNWSIWLDLRILLRSLLYCATQRTTDLRLPDPEEGAPFKAA